MSVGVERYHADTYGHVRARSRVLPRRAVTGHASCVVDETRYQGAAELRARREDREMTQQELADEAGVSLSSVGRLERGRRIDAKKERAIARALGLADHAVDAAFNGEPLPEAQATDALDEAEVTAKRLEIDTMSEEEMERVAEFVAEVRGDPAERYALMADMLRTRDARRRARALTQSENVRNGNPSVG